jgi:hypothetical protein
MTDLAAAVAREAVAGTTTVGGLGRVIDAHAWLVDSDVTRIEAVGGKLPISYPTHGTAAQIALPGHTAFVYIAIDEDFSARALAGGLRGDPGATPAAIAVLRQVAVQRVG